ncbi:MAG: helix-turn-helix domain-containing protein [Chloroflexi bacterium]|nr:helix-turn-helix domain-containing protein [Chloroflexota bacterium]
MSEDVTPYRAKAAWTAEGVAALRAQLRLSQAAFAAELGVRQQTVSEWETGRYQPRGASARMLAVLAEQAAPYDATPPVATEAQMAPRGRNQAGADVEASRGTG